jgi:ammonia channel protein AmtB
LAASKAFLNLALDFQLTRCVLLCTQAMGILRVSMDDELAGLDESHHGGSAYDFSSEGKGSHPPNM